MVAHHHITLPGDGTDFAHWRDVARHLLALGAAPQHVVWSTETGHMQTPDLFATPAPVTQLADLPPALPRKAYVPRWWLAQAEQCLLHRSPERFDLLYRLLWRMQRNTGLQQDPLDPDRMQLGNFLRQLRRDVHKMHAFVRFRPVTLPDDPVDGEGPLHVAWFEPDHHIVQAVAPFFVRRFANMRWAILTPECCLRWWPQVPDVQALVPHGIRADHAVQPLRGRSGVLSWGPGAQAAEAPAPDAGERLWLTYYAHTFNPARLKVAAMCREMPRKYWHNLPEAQLITPLIQAAQGRSAAMLAKAPSTPQRKRPALVPAPADPRRP